MTGPLAKADALLAARLAPWLELSAHKSPAGGEEQAQPVSRSPRIENDVLLPARAGLLSQVQAQLRAPASQTAAAHPAAGTAALSVAARAIVALESGLHASQAEPVRGSLALSPASRQAPAADALASALSRQVSESGLFYESHLAQFATGARSLAQMLREPQASLATAASAAADASAPAAQPQQRELANAQLRQLPVAPAQAATAAVPAAPATAMAALMPAMPLHQTPEQRAADAYVHQQADHAQRTELVERGPVRLHDAPALAAQASVAEPAAGAAVVHPQAAALVHQQLDLLASSMFRWTGEAWPGVPMDWTVEEEGARQQAAGEQGESSPHWSTTVSLDLPRLGSIEVSLRLAGAEVHAQVAALHSGSQEQLRANGKDLARRMSGAGLSLQSLQLDAGAMEP